MRLVRVLTLVITAFALLGAGTAQETPREGGVLRAGMSADPSSLDPHRSTDTTTRNIFENVYDTLVAFDADGNIVPSLAERWEIPDPTTYIFHLRSDVVFHSGDPFTADDVVFSIERITAEETASPWAADFAGISALVVEDEHRLRIELDAPFAPFLDNLAKTFNAIMSRNALGADGDASETIVGTGPFRFVEFVPGQRLVLERNPDYWKPGLPYLDGIEFLPFPDPVAQVTALRTGAVDWIEYVPDGEVEFFQSDPNFTVVGGLGTNFRALYRNMERPPLDDARVRQAIAWALDREEIVDVALFGVGGVPILGGPVPPGHWAHVDYMPYEQDFDRARALLAEAGYPDGFQMEMLINSNFAMLRTPAEVVQAQLAQVGIDLTIRLEEWTSYIDSVNRGDFNITVLGTSGLSDPDSYLFTQLHSTQGRNQVSWDDATFDRLVEQGRVTVDQEERRRIYEEAQRHLIDQVPMAYLFHSTQYEAMSNDVRGFVHWTNTSYLGFAATWLDR
jgi:peptide/nickel transport system substrate-binding protein